MLSIRRCWICAGSKFPNPPPPPPPPPPVRPPPLPPPLSCAINMLAVMHSTAARLVTKNDLMNFIVASLLSGCSYCFWFTETERNLLALCNLPDRHASDMPFCDYRDFGRSSNETRASPAQLHEVA